MKKFISFFCFSASKTEHGRRRGGYHREYHKCNAKQSEVVVTSLDSTIHTAQRSKNRLIQDLALRTHTSFLCLLKQRQTTSPLLRQTKYCHRTSIMASSSFSFFHYLFLISYVGFTTCVGAANVRINEVSDKGTSDVCDGSDWVELYNFDLSIAVDLTGFVLHDDGGPMDPDALIFPPSTILQPGDFLVVCAGGGGPELSAQFGIGGSDSITLRDAMGATVSSTGTSLDGSGDFDVTLAYNENETTSDAGTYVYTATPTPGAANVITQLPAPETVAQLKARLTAQNELGTKFFDMDSGGLPVDGGFPAVVDLRLVMNPDIKRSLTNDERGYEIYFPFDSATVTALEDPSNVLLTLDSAGRIRAKGQSSMYIGVCTNRTTPYQIDWNRQNASQTLFGMERTILRTAYADPSFVRDWASHRMLARFGLPHLRTRAVRLLMNGEVIGLYNLMEAPEQDYVFHRSFPDFDPGKCNMLVTYLCTALAVIQFPVLFRQNEVITLGPC